MSTSVNISPSSKFCSEVFCAYNKVIYIRSGPCLDGKIQQSVMVHWVQLLLTDHGWKLWVLATRGLVERFWSIRACRTRSIQMKGAPLYTNGFFVVSNSRSRKRPDLRWNPKRPSNWRWSVPREFKTPWLFARTIMPIYIRHRYGLRLVVAVVKSNYRGLYD